MRHSIKNRDNVAKSRPGSNTDSHGKSRTVMEFVLPGHGKLRITMKPILQHRKSRTVVKFEMMKNTRTNPD